MQTINNFVLSLLARIREGRDEEGQTLVEYGLILALISIVAIITLGLIGTEVSAVFNAIGIELGDATT